jgi:MSHA biogenesis protein MshP
VSIGNRDQRGFSVVLMLALIVLVGGMLAYTVSLGSTMHASMAQEIAAARASRAAQAGLEWGRFRIRMGAAPNCAATTHLNLPLASGAMPVTVRCTLTGTHTEGAATVRTYRLSATACRPAAAGSCPNAAGSGDYVEQVASGSAER